MQTIETIKATAAVISSLAIIIGVIIAVFKVYQNNKRQNEEIKDIKEEQTIICYGLKGALQGLIEQGCDGPCKDALNMLDKHLNQTAHQTNLTKE